MKRHSEKGVALILTLVLILAATAMTVSLVYVARSEAFSSMNYRLMSQSRDAAEGGVNKAANYLMNTYSKPGGAGNLMSNYGRTTSPVTYSGNSVVLSANTNKWTSHYPVSADQTAFSSAAQGTVAAGDTTVSYAASATLLSMRQVTPYGSTTPQTIQTWQIVSDGSVSGIQNSQVEVSAVMEQQVAPVFTYAAFADSAGCSALQFGGGGTTDSYDDSAALSGGKPVTAANTGNVGTNGNLATNGNPTTINGTLSSPRTGVGSCSTNNVTAWTDSSGHVTGPPGCNSQTSCSLVELPQPVVYPTPTIPANSSTTDIDSKGSCPAGLVGCSKGSNIVLDPSASGGSMFLRDINMNGNKDLHLKAGIYNINTLTQSGQTALVLDSVPVILNVTGNGGGTVVDITGGGVVNTGGNYDPMSFQMIYPGNGTVSLKGGAASVGLLYAPNASFSFGGNADWYGAVIGSTMTDMGGTAIHYDRRLSGKAFMVGNYTLGSYDWKKF